MRLSMKALLLLLVVAAASWMAFRVGNSQPVPKSGTESVSAAAHTAAGTGPKWQEWDPAYADASKSNRVVLVDLYTDWCGWCKKMDKDTYAEASVIEKINKDFVSVKLNPEKAQTYTYEGKKMTGQELVQRLNTLGGGSFRGYPTTAFIIPNAKGEDTVIIVSGYLGPDQFKSALDQVLAHAKNAPRG